MTVNEIKKIIEDGIFEYYGFRADNKEYNIRDICENSHQLFQDPDFDEDGDLIYPEVVDPESPYYGFFDGGELDGTCAVKTTVDSIEKAIEGVKIYPGRHVYFIGGYYAEYGYDDNEIIITHAEVLGVIA